MAADRGGYIYRDDHMSILHHTSIPEGDEAAIAYAATVEELYNFNHKVRWIEKREPDSFKYTMLDVMWDEETQSFVPLDVDKAVDNLKEQ